MSSPISFHISNPWRRNQVLLMPHITETLQRTVTVSASSRDDAYMKVREMYDAEIIVLDEADFVCVEFSPVPPSNDMAG